MKFKKIASVLAMAALSTSLLAACGQDAAVEDTDDTASAVSSAADTEETVDVVSSASLADNADGLVNALSADGNWVVVGTRDITLTENLNVDGDFHEEDDESNDLLRMLALAPYGGTEDFTLTVPKMTVNSLNFTIHQGTVKGDIYVNTEGFRLLHATVDGNVTFASQELMDSANLDKGEVTGEVTFVE